MLFKEVYFRRYYRHRLSNRDNSFTSRKGENDASTQETEYQHQVQHSFHQQLREHIRDATRVVMEEIMREELTEFLGVEWGECSTERKGYRNGSYTRDLATTSGPIEDLEVRRRSGRSVPHPDL